MGISLLDHKKLWGRSGNRCAMCRRLLVPKEESGVIGQEAHIVSRSTDGPRGQSSLTREQRDKYSNLILLCPSDHATIDNIPSGPFDYPVDTLHDLKRKHEGWVAESTEFDKKAQIAAEQWAGIIDQLSTKMAWDDWLTHSGWLQSADGPQLACEIHEQFKTVPPWILSRVWPQGHPRLRAVISQMALVLNDFLNVFGRHAKRMYDESPMLETVRFYQSGEWVDNYHELVRRYEYHVDLVQDLTLELTRYGNWIADIVRDEIDPSYRVEQGALLVMRGPNQNLQFETFRTEFSEEERSSERPYRGLDDFKRVRFTRDYVIGLQSGAESA